MDTTLKYVPILRGRQQEFSVLRSFDFESATYPCLEIIKEQERQQTKPRKGSKKPPKPQKKFEEVYLPLVQGIRAPKVFVDLPVHLKDHRQMKPDTLSFIRTVIKDRNKRTEYLRKLSPLSSKIIPVISTYFDISGEPNSITKQEKDLRGDFTVLAFRTFVSSFSRDIAQIKSVIRKTDYIIMDLQETDLDLSDSELISIEVELKTLRATVIIHRNPFPKDITHSSLVHGAKVDDINNHLLSLFKKLAGSCFSDYAGIKKDSISKGGSISPGFVYYDAVQNEFYGFKGNRQKLEEFKATIVPAVVSSAATRRMKASPMDFLGDENVGWEMIQLIHQGPDNGKSAAKFKRIGMEHYLHCIRTNIANGKF